MANNPRAADNLKPFKKKDPRINKAGRPNWTLTTLGPDSMRLELECDPVKGE